jgi:hypothetical protein
MAFEVYAPIVAWYTACIHERNRVKPSGVERGGQP